MLTVSNTGASPNSRRGALICHCSLPAPASGFPVEQTVHKDVREANDRRPTLTPYRELHSNSMMQHMKDRLLFPVFYCRRHSEVDFVVFCRFQESNCPFNLSDWLFLLFTKRKICWFVIGLWVFPLQRTGVKLVAISCRSSVTGVNSCTASF